MRFALLAVFLIACGPSGRNNPGDDDGPDAPGPECTDGTTRCAGAVREICQGGQFTTQEECAVACNDTLGCVNCQPGENVCQDGNVHSCDNDGNVGGETMACTGSTICSEGMCVDACIDAAEKKSYIGCEYMAVDLDNAVEVLGVAPAGNCTQPGARKVTLDACGNAANTAVQGLCDPGNVCPGATTCKAMSLCVLDAQGSPFAIVVSNPQARPVNVTITPPIGAPFTKVVDAGAVLAIEPQDEGVADQSVDGSGIARKAFKVTSDLPIVAYQFNPLDNANVFSNDASLLIPRTAFDIEYFVMTMPTLGRRPANHSYNGYLTVVAAEDNTVIEVTPTAATRPGTGAAAIAANTPTQFTLQAFEVLTLQSIDGGDLTGTKVRSVNGTTTFGVFGGHEATGFGESMSPDPLMPQGPCCADHLEEMLFPTSTWGKTFAMARSRDRGTNEPDMLRIMAQKPGTTITFDPAPAAGSCGTLAPGAFCEVKIQVDTAISSNEPILVGHFLQSAIWQGFGSIGEGDPSLALAVPVEQFRTEYTVLVPNAYAKNFLSITATSAGAVTVDGLNVQMEPFAGQYRAARMQVVAGQHKIVCPNSCSVEVYGYDSAVSYMFAGGLDLKQIVLE
jgi:hypothetical protein